MPHMRILVLGSCGANIVSFGVAARGLDPRRDRTTYLSR